MSIWHRTTPAAGGPPNNHVPVPAPPPPPRWRFWLLPIGIAFTALLLFHPGSNGTPTQNFSYTGFVNDVTTDTVSTAAISSTGSVSGQLQGGAPYTSQIPAALPSRDNPFAGRAGTPVATGADSQAAPHTEVSMLAVSLTVGGAVATASSGVALVLTRRRAGSCRPSQASG